MPFGIYNRSRFVSSTTQKFVAASHTSSFLLQIQALENRLRNLGQANESTFPHVRSAPLENVEDSENIDDLDISNSLENCCVSSRTRSRGGSPPPPPRNDSDAADAPEAVTDDDGRSPPLKTNEDTNLREKVASAIAVDDNDDVEISATNDDALSIADSFTEFQSAEDRGDAFFNDASLLSNGCSFAKSPLTTQTSTRHHPPPFSESDYFPGADGSRVEKPPAANVASEAAIKDLLFWEFDGRCDEEDDRGGSAPASAPAILTPTVLK